MRGVRLAVFGTSSASAVITMATHCQCMWRQRDAGRRRSLVHSRRFLRRSFAKLMTDIETGNVFSFPALKMFYPFFWSRSLYNFRKEFERFKATQDLLDASHVLLSRPPNRVDNLVLVKFGFSALSVPRFFGA